MQVTNLTTYLIFECLESTAVMNSREAQKEIPSLTWKSDEVYFTHRSAYIGNYAKCCLCTISELPWARRNVKMSGTYFIRLKVTIKIKVLPRKPGTSVLLCWRIPEIWQIRIIHEAFIFQQHRFLCALNRFLYIILHKNGIEPYWT